MDEDLNKIRIPLAELRVQIVNMMKQGESDVALGDYLYMLRALYRKSRDGDKQSEGVDKTADSGYTRPNS